MDMGTIFNMDNISTMIIHFITKPSSNYINLRKFLQILTYFDFYLLF